LSYTAICYDIYHTLSHDIYCKKICMSHTGRGVGTAPQMQASESSTECLSQRHPSRTLHGMSAWRIASVPHRSLWRLHHVFEIKCVTVPWLSDPALITSRPGAAVTTYVIRWSPMTGLLQCRLDWGTVSHPSSRFLFVNDSSQSRLWSSLINKHEGNLGKHLTGDRARTLLFTLPFVPSSAGPHFSRVYKIPCYSIYNGIYHEI